MSRSSLHTYFWCGIWILLGYLPQTVSAQEPAFSATLLDQGLLYKSHPQANKIHPSLLYLSDWYEAHATPGGLPLSLPPGLAGNPFIVGEEVFIEAVAVSSGEELLAELVGLGLSQPSQYQRVVDGKLPIAQLKFLHTLTSLQLVRFQSPAVAHTGAVTTLGDAAINAGIARTTFGIDGTGVKVCAISDSYDALGGAAGGIASGDLPGVGNTANPIPVDVVAEIPATPATFVPTDEGRGMLELIHDVAPGATLGFHTADGGRSAMASAITNLQTAGCDIILDDVGYFLSPFFQDGIIAQAVNTANTAGVTYLSAAGNYGIESYGAPFSGDHVPFSIPVTIPGFGTFIIDYAEAHEFGTGDIFQEINIPKGESMNILLQWSAPAASVGALGGPTTDYDLFLLDSARTTILAASFNPNSGGDPAEFFQGGYTNNTANTKFNILILRDSLATNIGLDMRMVLIGSSTLRFEEYRTQSPAIYGQPNTDGAISIGASAYPFTPPFGTPSPLLNTFSSQGGGAITYDISGNPITTPLVRQKPDVVAADGGQTTFFPSVGVGFFGTSASVAHAAGVVALMKEYSPTLTPAAAELALESSALDMVQDDAGGTFNFAIGYDTRSGYGLIQADEAIDQILPVTLQSFEAVAYSQSIRLQWETSEEINNQGFEIELKLEEATSFTTQQFVPSLGDDGGIYQARIPNLSPGNYEVRLGQRDLNGAITYSAIQSIRIFASDSPPQLSLHQGMLMFDNHNGLASYQLTVYNLSGQIIWETSQLSRSQIVPFEIPPQILHYRLTAFVPNQAAQTYVGKWMVE